MVKKIITLVFLNLFFLWSCATYQPPSLYIENLPPSQVTELSLDERILVEDAWKNLKKGKIKKARKMFSRLDEDSPFYYVGLGYSHLLLDDFQASEDFFQKALQNHPDMVLIHLGLAQLYKKTGQEDQMFSQFREILKREPQHPWVKPKYESIKRKKTQQYLEEARHFLSQGKKEKSKQAFRKALYYSPNSTEAHVALAQLYTKEKDFDKAVVHLKTAASNEPKNVEILKKYGETLLKAKKYKKSLEIYKKIAQMQPKDTQVQQRIESLKNRLGIYKLPPQYNAIPSSETITKEQLAALIRQKFKKILDEPKKSPPIIIDISTSWASESIIQMATLGLMDVYPNHTFQPKKVITRAEMAEILLSLINRLEEKGYTVVQQIPPEKIEISDVSPENYYYRPILQILSYDLMNLNSKKEFKPEHPVSGQKSINLLELVLNLIK
ncbi:tetratricopeptide repeat protein [bacterium]|nr:tetratricopeptide repeat protein [bacterium]